jgi:APA family basic amino acid/polyamine antiporter
VSSHQLARVLGTSGATLMGLGSIIGTGIFVSVGAAAGIAGPWVLVAVALAAGVAACNGLSSAQLAAAHPVSGGTYEYGYRYATPTVGFVAGVTFVAAKTASAATATLGCAAYALALAGVSSRAAQIGLAVAIVATLTLLVTGGASRSARVNTAIVAITIAGLVAFVGFGLPHVDTANLALAGTGGDFDGSALLHATALMFVAYTGYGRIATLGEEVREPRKTIPRAIVLALAIALVLYLGVTAVAVGVSGPAGLAGPAPLETISASLSMPLRYVVAVAAITAMLGVILNLVLGISRVVLAMARRGDLPTALARVDRGSPRRAVVITGAAIAALALIGSVKTTWSFSAFSVLVYYAIANACALRQPAEERRFPRAVPVAGLVACLGLAWWVEPRIWLVGVGLVVVAVLARRLSPARGSSTQSR